MQKDTKMNEQEFAYRHTWNGQHYFYYHSMCVESNPPGPETSFELIPLDTVPQGAECDLCYRLVHRSNEKGEVRA